MRGSARVVIFRKQVCHLNFEETECRRMCVVRSFSLLEVAYAVLLGHLSALRKHV